MAAAKPKGLQLTRSTAILKLSGPVSIVILRPNYESDYFKTYKKAPIFILLGDIHFNTANLCQPADNAISIYTKEFLEKICAAVNPGEIIDFCTEGQDLTNQIYHSDQKGDVMHEFHNLVRYCNKIKQDKTQGYEFLDKIRWQHTDIRFWTLDTPELKEVTQKRPRKYYHMALFLLSIVEKHPLFLKNPTSEMFARVFAASAKQFNLAGYTFEANIAVNVREIYSKLVKNRYSLINYQISKITEESDREFLKTKICEYINYMYKIECTLSKLSPEELGPLIRQTHDQIIRLYNSKITAKEIDELKEMYASNEYIIYKNYILNIGTIKFDMFTFAKSFTRMLNPTPDSQPPIINICYFGNLHIQNMTHFITNILGYSQVFEKKTFDVSQPETMASNKVNRCLDFSKDNILFYGFLIALRSQSGRK